MVIGYAKAFAFALLALQLPSLASHKRAKSSTSQHANRQRGME